MRNELCFFCSGDTTRVDEHYFCCANCNAVYTYLILQETNCVHIKDRCPNVVQQPKPEFADNKDIPPYIIITEGANSETDQICSVCGAECIADGW